MLYLHALNQSLDLLKSRESYVIDFNRIRIWPHVFIDQKSFKQILHRIYTDH